jgi:hypothetical protein
MTPEVTDFNNNIKHHGKILSLYLNIIYIQLIRYLAYYLKDILKSGDLVPDANGQHDVPITEDFVVSHHRVIHFKPEI